MGGSLERGDEPRVGGSGSGHGSGWRTRYPGDPSESVAFCVVNSGSVLGSLDSHSSVATDTEILSPPPGLPVRKLDAYEQAVQTAPINSLRKAYNDRRIPSEGIREVLVRRLISHLSISRKGKCSSLISPWILAIGSPSLWCAWRLAGYSFVPLSTCLASGQHSCWAFPRLALETECDVFLHRCATLAILWQYFDDL